MSKDRSMVKAPRTVLLAVVAAAAFALAGCGGGTPPSTFDLTAPARLPGAGGVRGTLVVAEPVAVAVLDGQRVVVKPDAGTVTYLPNAQWSDRLPKLVQSKIIEAYENSNRLRAVGRPGDRLSVDYQLVSELRAFEIDAATGQASVELTAKIVNDKTGKIVSGQVFSARRALAGPLDGPTATRALNEALAEVLARLVAWTGNGA
ncbi:ABC-type transport auxiliary lipoprotein family protein [Hansschlegelia plantiphila]|uniref:ABC transporter n=1 Tax=Hansschlegelia plantiphila TaxID=374655 RepID=A0A9W6IZG7_9HYPH|nr:ABC-type transport auxiliary lipoprotein family protein [Hansschlegelia plantiphila]GLK68055.1 ABC transporter [Hansschlegelia plantiphila]